MVGILDGLTGLGSSFRIDYTAYSAQYLVLVSVPTETKHFESSRVIKDGTDSREATRDDEGTNNILNELNAAIKVAHANAS